MPHRGLEPESVLRLAFQSDALPTELPRPYGLLVPDSDESESVYTFYLLYKLNEGDSDDGDDSVDSASDDDDNDGVGDVVTYLSRWERCARLQDRRR